MSALTDAQAARVEASRGLDAAWDALNSAARVVTNIATTETDLSGYSLAVEEYRRADAEYDAAYALWESRLAAVRDAREAVSQ